MTKVLVSNVKGPKGDKGEKGDQGIPGTNGLPGPAGPNSVPTREFMAAEAADESSPFRAELNSTFGRDWTPAAIACTGDSWTEGNQDGTGTRYPSLLGTALAWATVANLGKSGWTSTEIAAKWGAPFYLGGFVTATDATTQTAVSIQAPTSTFRTGSSITNFDWVGELRLADGSTVAGTLHHTATSATWSDGWTFKRSAAGAAVTVPAGSMFVCTEYDQYKRATQIIGVGRNNISDPAVVVRDVAAIRAAHLAPGAPFLVLAVPTAASETAGTVPYARIKRVNEALRATFPAQFLDTRRYLVDRGLVVTGTSASSTDMDQFIGDTIPQSLLYASAYDHPNATGYKAITMCVLGGLTKVGALIGPSAGVSGVTAQAIGPMVWSADDNRDPLNTPVNNMLDRTGFTVLQSASTAAAPILQWDATAGRRYLRFDGTDDRMYGIFPTGIDLPQPFTVIAKARFRDLSTYAQGVVWTYSGTGATFSVSTSGRVVLNAASAVQTATGAVVQGNVYTIAGVAAGAASLAGIGGSTLTAGDAGTRGLFTQLYIGYYSGPTYAAMDLFELRVYPWALTEAQVTALAAQIG